MSVPVCPRCGGPAREVVTLLSWVRRELNPDGTAGKFISASRTKKGEMFKCGGGHSFEIGQGAAPQEPEWEN